MSTPSGNDLDLPIADLLRAGTAAAHHNVEHSKGAIALTKGELDRDEYVRFLIMLYNVYEYVPGFLYATFSTAANMHASSPRMFDAVSYVPTLQRP